MTTREFVLRSILCNLDALYAGHHQQAGQEIVILLEHSGENSSCMKPPEEYNWTHGERDGEAFSCESERGMETCTKNN